MECQVAIVAIARRENAYINEWIQYHRNIGIGHFYIYDNSFGDEPRIDEALDNENMRCTTIIPAYDIEYYQRTAYTNAYMKFNSNHQYLLFIDIDEFFTLCKHKNMADYIAFLQDACPNFQVARVNWEIYDDNDAIERDMSIPVHQFFTHPSTTQYSLKCNHSTKSLVKCGLSDISFDDSAHYPTSSSPLLVCDASGHKIKTKSHFLENADISMAKIRHYTTKTISEYIDQKLGITNGDRNIADRTINNRFFVYCQRTKEKEDYYKMNKPIELNMTLISIFYDTGINPLRKHATKQAISCWMKQKNLPQ